MSPAAGAADDEGLHPAGDDPDWQESAYLAWRDPVSGLGGNHRIGNELNRGTANLWCGVYREDGTRFRCNGEGLDLVRLGDPGDTGDLGGPGGFGEPGASGASAVRGLCAGPQRMFSDGERLRFVLEDVGCRVELDITDEGERAYANAKTFSGTTGVAGTIFANNFHVFCRVRGMVELDGVRSDVDAPAWRDHSWGARRWDSFLSSRSFGGSHGEGADLVRFRFASMVGANGSFFRHGGMERGGRRVGVTGASMLVHVDDDSVRCPSAEVRFELEDGGSTTVRIETMGGVLGVTAQRYGWESVGDLSVDGEPGGWGFLETTLNARNGHSPPAHVLGDTLTNGVVRPSADSDPAG